MPRLSPLPVTILISIGYHIQICTDLRLQGGVGTQLGTAPAHLEKTLRSRRLAYYSQCELLVYQQHKAGHGKGRFRKARVEGSSGDDVESSQKDAASVFLQIQ